MPRKLVQLIWLCVIYIFHSFNPSIIVCRSATVADIPVFLQQAGPPECQSPICFCYQPVALPAVMCLVGQLMCCTQIFWVKCQTLYTSVSVNKISLLNSQFNKDKMNTSSENIGRGLTIVSLFVGQEEWTNSRHKAPPARTTKGVYRDQPYARY